MGTSWPHKVHEIKSICKLGCGFHISCGAFISGHSIHLSMEVVMEAWVEPSATFVPCVFIPEKHRCSAGGPRNVETWKWVRISHVFFGGRHFQE